MFRPEASPEDRERVRRELASLLEAEEDIVLAYLHGSFLETMYQDIDVAVLLDPESASVDGLTRCLRLSGTLTRGLDADVEVDVRPLLDAPLPFRFEVLRKGELLLARDDDQRVAFETATIRAFHDFQHHFETYRREVVGAGT